MASGLTNSLASASLGLPDTHGNDPVLFRTSVSREPRFPARLG